MGLQVACKGLEVIGGLVRTDDLANAQVWVKERLAHQIGAVVRRAWKGGGGVLWGSKDSGVRRKIMDRGRNRFG